MDRREVVEALARSDLFGSLSGAALRAVAAQFEVVDVGAGTMLFNQGDLGDALYVVVRGRLRVFREEGPLAQHKLAEVGPGEVVGELAVVSQRARMASVQAIRDTVLLRLSKESFHAVVAGRPSALLDLVEVLVDRISLPTTSIRPGAHTVALVTAGGTDPSVARSVARALAVSLRTFGSVAVVGPGDDLAGGSDTNGAPIDDVRPAAHLHELERRADVVLLWTTSRTSDWSSRCLRQADRVLLVADVRASPGLTPAEQAPGLARRDLVLVHPAGSGELSGTAQWLPDRSVQTHHQVRVGSRPDCDRLARSLMGRSIGLVLSGGGPRGFAHLGAVQAIQEAGIPIDAVGGTSIGALMGAGLAYGWDHESIIERASQALSGRGSLLRPTLPLVSLSSGRRVEKMLRSPDFLGERRMEDAVLPWFCVSTSLRTAKIVVHDHGPAWLAVRSSFALPGVLPPVFDDGDLLVDGGVLDNLPIDVMRLRIDGSVLAIDLEPDHDGRAHLPFDPSLSGWRVLGQRLNPFVTTSAPPSAVQVLLRSKQVGGRHLQRRVIDAHPVELYVRPQLNELGALDFRGGAALVSEGYRQTLAVLARTDLSSLLPPSRSAGGRQRLRAAARNGRSRRREADSTSAGGEA